MRQLLVMTAVLILSGQVSASESPFYLTVKESAGDTAWNKQYCGVIHTAIVATLGSGPASQCAVADKSETDRQKGTGTFRYHIEADRQADHSVNLSIENWDSKRDDTDFTRLSWKVEGLDEKVQQLSIKKLVSHFVTYSNNQRLLKEWALVQGSSNSKLIELGKDGKYRARASGKTIEFDEAYNTFQYESPAQKHYLRATLELAGVLGIGLLNYFKEVDINSRDWALDYDWKSLRRKLVLEAWEFDNNLYNTNALGHSITGAIFYTTARSNRLNILESALFAFAGSTLWEFFAEFREKVSINDMISTPIAGTAIGEVFHQLGAFFDRGDRNVFTTLLASIFGGPRKFHDWIDKNHLVRSGKVTRLGLSEAGWHEFKLFGGGGTVSGGGLTSPSAQFGLQTEIINVAAYGRPGQVSRILTDGNFTKLLVEATLSQGSMQDFKFFTQAALAGYYKQDIREMASGQLKGYSFFVGTSTAFEYDLHQYAQGTLNTHSDKLAVVNILGSTLELNLYLKGVHVRANLDVFADFAMLRSFAIDSYSQSGNPMINLSTPLKNEQYYHAFGGTITPRVQVEYQNWEVGAEAQMEAFVATRFRDRNQDSLTNQVANGDNRARLKAWVAYNLPGGWSKIVLSVQKRYRSGYVGSVLDSVDETEAMASLMILF